MGCGGAWVGGIARHSQAYCSETPNSSPTHYLVSRLKISFKQGCARFGSVISIIRNRNQSHRLIGSVNSINLSVFCSVRLIFG
ncbi:hypothetical protein Hanom_Chr12g01108351 [Helianthus anomalus]